MAHGTFEHWRFGTTALGKGWAERRPHIQPSERSQENGPYPVGASPGVALRWTRLRHPRPVDRGGRRVSGLAHRRGGGPGRRFWGAGALVPLVDRNRRHVEPRTTKILRIRMRR